MAKLTAHGTELLRYFSTRYRALLSVRSDGVTLVRRTFHGWKVLGRKKPDVSMERWLEAKRKQFEAEPAWARECRSIPSYLTLEEWVRKDRCETPSGDVVETDGRGPDGAPSWLSALGMI